MDCFEIEMERPYLQAAGKQITEYITLFDWEKSANGEPPSSSLLLVIIWYKWK